MNILSIWENTELSTDFMVGFSQMIKSKVKEKYWGLKRPMIENRTKEAL